MQIDMDRETEIALVRAAQGGCADSFGELYRYYHTNIVGLMLSNLRFDRNACEDLASETFIRALRHIGSFSYGDGSGRFMAWLATIAFNILRDYTKSHTFVRSLPVAEMHETSSPMFVESPDGPPEALERAEDRRLVLRAMKGLTEQQKTAVLLFYIGGHTQLEVSRRVGTTERGAKSMLYRARQTMLRTLAESDHRA